MKDRYHACSHLSRRLLTALWVVLLAALLLAACGETETESELARPTETESGPYDYDAVDWEDFMSLVRVRPSSYQTYWDEAAIQAYDELIAYGLENEGKLTQSELDALIQEIQDMRDNPTYRQSDVAQVYISASKNSFTKDWYTNIRIAIVGPEGRGFKTIVDETAGLKLHGNSTRLGDFPRYSYTLKLSQGKNVLGMGKAKKWVLLANLFDTTLLRNRLVSDFSKDAGLEFTLDTQMAEVYINGKYQGLYLFCEKIDASDYSDGLDYDAGDALLEWDFRTKASKTYFKSKYYLNDTQGNKFQIEINAPEDISAAQVKYYESVIHTFEDALYTKNWAKLKQLIDVQTFVDYYVLSEYFKPVDFNNASVWFYLEDGILNAGPLWDYDLAMGNVGSTGGVSRKYLIYNNLPGSGDGSYDSTHGIYCSLKPAFPDLVDLGRWFVTFMEIPEFRALAIARFKELQPLIVNLYQDNELGKNRIDSLLEEYGAAIDRSWSAATWPISTHWSIYAGAPLDTYEDNVEYLRAWLKGRNEWLLNEWGL